MMSNSNLIGVEYENISQTVTIVPRLQYSNNLLSDIIDILKNKRNELKKLNRHLLDVCNGDNTYLKTLAMERDLLFSLELLTQIQKKINAISGITSIPELLPSVMPIIRIVSAQLFYTLPVCSQKLCELSVYLGSIVLDSAILTKARFDFDKSNAESSIILDKVKLMADSKISKQYPNLDFFKGCNT